MDIKFSANTLIHDNMSSLLLVPKFADSFLGTVTQSFYTTYLWRVKVSVLKFVQILVFSNIYELEKGIRPAKVLRLLYDAIIDHQSRVIRFGLDLFFPNPTFLLRMEPNLDKRFELFKPLRMISMNSQVEVRMEASRAMLTLILCEYIKVDDELTNYLNDLMKNKSTPSLHGAILGMGAVVRAHPFSTPPTIKPMLRALCGVTSHNAELQKTATTALREFRRTHRENWEKTANFWDRTLCTRSRMLLHPFTMLEILILICFRGLPSILDLFYFSKPCEI
ncbi:hypothetical protein COOONC_01693 [Cooperia oncophora]